MIDQFPSRGPGDVQDDPVIVLPLADGSTLLMARSAAHRVVTRSGPQMYGGSANNEVATMKSFTLDLIAASSSLHDEIAKRGAR